jgi:hypothetical protein
MLLYLIEVQAVYFDLLEEFSKGKVLKVQQHGKLLKKYSY